jgi:hypothetical protein
LELRIQVFWGVTRSSRVTDCRRFKGIAVSRIEPYRKTNRTIKSEGKDKVHPRTGHEDPEEE